MKRTIFLIAVLISLTLQAQQLASIYKGGEIKLVPDAEYAKNTDWNKLFPDYNQTAGSSTIGIYKQIVVAPDGSVFMSHHTRHSISKFDKYGNFVKEFGKQGGKKASDFIYMPSVQGILDGKYLYTTAVDGRMHFFDLNGNWVKTIKLKYLPLGSIPLKGGKIAIMGHVPCGNGSKQIVSLLNVSDGKEKIISSFFESYNKEKAFLFSNPYVYKDKEGKEKRICMINFSSPFSDEFIFRPRFATTTNGNLIAAYPSTGQIKIFDQSGRVIRQFKTDLKSDVITKEDREDFYQNALRKSKELEADLVKTANDKVNWDKYIEQFKPMIERLRDPAAYPQGLPYFSEMIIDSENNILLFRFTREQGSNKFDVYTYNSQGAKIATSTFIADNYDLKINPSVFKFHNGSIYSFVKRKNAIGNPMRLVKFNLKRN